jgi:hypothetical protein
MQMRKFALVCCFGILTMPFGLRTLAQESSNLQEAAKVPDGPARFYHLEFVVREIGEDGKPRNSRSYTTMVSTDVHDREMSIRTNSKIPVLTSENGPQSPAQFQYQDVGVNIDVRKTHEVDRQLSLDLVAVVSSVASASDIAGTREPVFRENKWQASVLIPIGKPAVVFTSDSLDSKGSMQVVVTATPLP